MSAGNLSTVLESCDTDTVLNDEYPSDDLPEVELPPVVITNQTIRVNTFTFITQMIGASLLSIPYIFARMGIVLATIVISVVLVASLVLILQVINACYYTNSQTFKQVTQKVFGSKFAVCIDVALILNSYGFLVSYIIIAAQSFETAVSLFTKIDSDSQSFDLYLVIKAVLAFGVMLPLSLLRRLRVLGMVASAGIGLVVLTVLSVIVYYLVSYARDGQTCMFKNANYEPGLRPPPPIWPRPYIQRDVEGNSVFTLSSPVLGTIFSFSYIPMLMGSFSLHAGAPPVLYELKGIDSQRLRSIQKSMYYAFAFCFLMYLLMGNFGALLYSHTISTNILYSFQRCDRDIYLTIVGIAYALMVCIAYPLIQYPLKVSIMSYCNLKPSQKCLSYFIYFSISVGFALLAFTLAAVYDNIATIFSIFGSVCGVFIYFIVPILLWYKLPKLKARSPIIDRLNLLLQPQHDIDDIRDVTTMAFLGAQHGSSISARDCSYIPDLIFSTPAQTPIMHTQKSSECSVHFVSAAHSSCEERPDESECVPLLAPVASMKRNKMLQPSECFETADKQMEIELSKQTEEIRQGLLRKMTLPRKIGFYTLLVTFVCICAESLIVNLMDFVFAA